jgi:ABC-2 type transport system ATP-binding protein
MKFAVSVDRLTKSFRTRKAGRESWGVWSKFKAAFDSQTEQAIAVDQISFEVAEGESVAFIGPNGAGKSTTIKMLTGILHPTSGSAIVGGMVPWENRKRLAYRIGTVFGQRSQLWYQLPARDSFELLRLIYEIPKPEFRDHFDQLVNRFDLKPLLGRSVRKLSLGERMRCEVAASLIHRPKIIFLDEPTIGLDVIAKREVRDLIRQVNRDEGVTVFLTSHDAGDVEQVSRRVMIVDHGKIVVDTNTGKLKRDYLKNRVVDLVADRELGDFPAEIAVGMKILKQTGLKYKLAINTDLLAIDRALDFIVRSSGVIDIVVSSPPMEEIIASIYQNRGNTGLLT